MSSSAIHPPSAPRPNWPALAGFAGALAFSALFWTGIAVALLRR